MSYATSPQIGRAREGLLARVSQALAAAKEMLRRRKVYETTLRELNALSTRELADLGISRTMITRLALEAADGKKQV